MAFTSQLKQQLDLPVWQITAPSIAVSSALSSSTNPDNPRLEVKTGRYIYYLNSATQFLKYDTISNGWSQLATPATAPLSYSSMKFAYSAGFQNSVISATSTTITAGVPNSALGYTVKIVSGTGAGQQRVITEIGTPVIADFGSATAGTLNNITNTNKAYSINQYVGYLLRTVGGAGQFQTRKILYNSATVLTIADPNKYAENLLCNSPYVANAPYAVPTAGTMYQIESNTFTVDDAWDVTPDATSVFKIFSGGIWLVSSAAAAPFYTVQYYDILSNQWYLRNATGGLVLTAVSTEVAIERTGESASMWIKSVATGTHSTTTLQDTNQEWGTNQWAGYYIRIFSGGGKNQLAKIASNNIDTLTFTAPLSVAPTNTSQYIITGFDAGMATSAGTTAGVSTLTDSTKSWSTNRWNNMEVEIVAGTGNGQSRHVRATSATQLTVFPQWSVIPDNTSIYVIHGDNDSVYMSFAGRPELFTYSTGSDLTLRSRKFEFGTAKGVSVQFGDNTPLAVATATYANPTLTVTTVNPHNFRTGNVIKMRGDTGAGAVINNAVGGYACTVTGANTFTLSVGAGSASVTVTAQSTTTLTDATKTWSTDQWAGYVVTFNNVQGPSAATHFGSVIISNTATTLTFATTTAPVQGVSRYAITASATHPLKNMIGADDSGVATGTQSTTTLQDTSKTWAVGSWVGKFVVMLAGTGQNQALAITANTANTLTFATGTAPVTGVTAYAITTNTSLVGLGAGLNWVYNNSNSNLKGSYIVRLRGGALLGLERFNIQTDTLELLQPQDNFEIFTTGTMSAYDGGNYIYMNKESTGRLYVYDVENNRLFSAGQIPFSAFLTAIVGNRMEVFEMLDSKKAGIKFLWLNKHTLAENVRTLLFWEK
jgi:hypothetical protein